MGEALGKLNGWKCTACNLNLQGAVAGCCLWMNGFDPCLAGIRPALFLILQGNACFQKGILPRSMMEVFLKLQCHSSSLGMRVKNS